jgi:hypothetical protein
MALRPRCSTPLGVLAVSRQDSHEGQGPPHARRGRVREICRFGPIAGNRKNRPWTALASGPCPRMRWGAFCCSVPGCSAGRRFASIYPGPASGRSGGSAALGAKRKISSAHPRRVCRNYRRARKPWSCGSEMCRTTRPSAHPRGGKVPGGCGKAARFAAGGWATIGKPALAAATRGLTVYFPGRQESRRRGREDCARYLSTRAFRMSAGPLPGFPHAKYRVWGPLRRGDRPAP